MKPIDETIKSWGATDVGSETWHLSGYQNWWSAALDHFAEQGCTAYDDECEVWEETDPDPPEFGISGCRMLDELRCEGNEGYGIEAADGFLVSDVTDEQENELEEAVRKVAGEWLDRHKLRPTWKVGGRSWVVTLGQAKSRAAQESNSPEIPDGSKEGGAK